MDNALMVGLSRQLTLRRAMEITANNLANMSTAGFKVERPALEAVQERPARHADGPRPISFVGEWAMVRDFRPGALEVTGRPLDVAIKGDGFFAVQVDGEERYTRDGRFAMDPDGRLTTASGRPVLDEAGGEIVLNPEARPPTIDERGVISQDGAEVARLGVVNFDDLATLEKSGDGLFAAGGAPAQPMDAPRLQQGYAERSNVTPVLEITRMIEIQRAYQSVTRMINTEEDMKRRAVERLGRVQ